MNTKRWVALLAFVTSAAVLPNAAGFITGVEFGAGGPPGVLGTYTMTGAFYAGEEYDMVDSFAFGSRTVTLDSLLDVYQVGGGWLTWSNGYTGKVLHLDTEIWMTKTVQLLLPAETLAFYLYVQPNVFDEFLFTISAANSLGSTSFDNVMIEGDSGAKGFGFYTTEPLFPIESISVTITGDNADDAGGFAIGQFGIDGVPGVPDGGATAVLLGFAALALASLRRAWSR